MKRDLELVRKILIAIEDQYNNVALYNLSIENYDLDTVAYHCSILYNAGLISDYKGQYADGRIYSFGVGSLTWEGHDFLDAAKNETIWRKTMKVVKEKGGGITIDVLKQLLTQAAKNLFLE